MNFITIAYSSIIVILLPACGALPDDQAASGEPDAYALESAFKVPNALNLNALNLNALNLNALNLNALNLSALTPEAADSLNALGLSGELARQALKYMVGCALRPDQSLTLSWDDDARVDHEETYQGLLGLAPTWIDSPLSKADQEWISACLASRVNYYGVSVWLSSRAPHPALSKLEDDERATFTTLEGAFWGNLFGESPKVNACYTAANVDHARSERRDCAAGHINSMGGVEECGIIRIAGRCDALCANLHPHGGYHPSCSDGAGSKATSRVITVALQ